MPRDLADLMHELGPEFAARAAHYDGDDLFVADNYADLKKHGVLPAGIPAELGGGGAEHSELAEMLRVLARYCGSTALALSMHTHQVATALWRWRRNSPPLERLLRSVAAENLVLVSSGGSDWIAGPARRNGSRVDGALPHARFLRVGFQSVTYSLPVPCGMTPKMAQPCYISRSRSGQAE
jgi:alkylation response protein AidB-like acyl-CoA dehydrogenase